MSDKNVDILDDLVHERGEIVHRILELESELKELRREKIEVEAEIEWRLRETTSC